MQPLICTQQTHPCPRMSSWFALKRTARLIRLAVRLSCGERAVGPLCGISIQLRRMTGSTQNLLQGLNSAIAHSTRHPLPLLQPAFQPIQIIHHRIESISIATIDFLNLHLNLVGKAHFHLSLLLFNNGLNSF